MAGEPMVDPDTSVPDSEEFRRVMKVIADYNALVDRAKFILESYLHRPYTIVDEPRFARLSITETNHVEIIWPELSEGYYNACSIELQHAQIEPTLFVKSVEELEMLATIEQVREHERAEAKLLRQKVMQRVMDENNERAELARLKAKYEVQKPNYTDNELDDLWYEKNGGDHDNS